MDKKRGRKKKLVNLDNDAENLLDSGNQEEIIILTLPITYEYIISRLDDSDFMNDKISNIMSSDPNNVIPINNTRYDTENNKDIELDIVNNISTEIFNSINCNGKKINTVVKTCSTLPVEINLKNISELKSMKTDVSCWWCCYQFDVFPVCAPFKYDVKSKVFKVKGCFCSFNCAKAYIDTDKMIRDKSLLNLLKKILTGEVSYNIKKALPKAILKKFGGPMGIQEYRESFNMLGKYTVNTYPMIYSPLQLEEKNEDIMIKKSIEKINLAKIKTPIKDKNTRPSANIISTSTNKKSLSFRLGITIKK